MKLLLGQIIVAILLMTFVSVVIAGASAIIALIVAGVGDAEHFNSTLKTTAGTLGILLGILIIIFSFSKQDHGE